jgi:phosphatidate phosphatase LPIN
MIGRDWTHVGVAKLYTDIAANGYNIFYLTSRSVGQADTTRGYLDGIVQDGHKLPKGPVIMSPDRTMAALRREVYLRKPEVFKMACLRDIMSLFQPTLQEDLPPTARQTHRTPFYSGFGNRLTDALSYRSVGIPPTRIFTLNSNAEVSLHLLTLNTYRLSYLSIWELVDHYFPPVGLRVNEGGEEYTDFNYWREQPLELDDFSASESEDEDQDDDEDDDDDADGRPSLDDYAGTEQDMDASFMSRDSMDDTLEDSALLDGADQDEEVDELGGLITSIILEEPEEEEAAEDELLVEESERLDALDLASAEENHQEPRLTRVATSPTIGGTTTGTATGS